ncbi:hypothetical protein [Bradyrhizobium sp. OHSU_III]|jgi:hypothetical protein|uniref:hypothetical protein n=1 Tax=Bradyrhizobium sp. OHSU_III TaxID=1297865 RepID=UPI00046328C6|nr:hypothetical protein [Bradyrhizobium sp. OHSU_III]
MPQQYLDKPSGQQSAAAPEEIADVPEEKSIARRRQTDKFSMRQNLTMFSYSGPISRGVPG